MKSTLVLFFLFLTSTIFAQEVSLKGVLLDGEFDNEPLAFATVTVEGIGKTVNTDENGEYYLEIESGIYTLVFDFVGYESKEIKDVVVEKNPIRLDDEIMNARKIAVRVVSIE